MKAIILTYAPVTESEQKILKNCKIYKLALNQHARPLNPDARIITDYILNNILKSTSEKIISVRESCISDTTRVEYYNGEFKGTTILSAIDYLISKKYDEILIVGDNSVNNLKFREIVNRGISEIGKEIKLYQYSDGNFNLPAISIAEFCEQ